MEDNEEEEKKKKRRMKRMMTTKRITRGRKRKRTTKRRRKRRSRPTISKRRIGRGRSGEEETHWSFVLSPHFTHPCNRHRKVIYLLIINIFINNIE